MGKDMWGNEEEPFEDRPMEMENGQWKDIETSLPNHPQAQQRRQPAPQPTIMQAYDENPALDAVLQEVEDEETDYTQVLNDANLRIEQGRLYQMIMNHDLFEGMDADPRAVANVQREIRKYARESMEVMLGMRQTTPAHAGPIVSSPFNDLEVDILKKLASKASGGATETPEANQVAEKIREVPRRTSLNPIGGATALKARPAPIQQRPAQPQQKLPTKAAAPVPRKRLDETTEQILAEEGVAATEAELDYKPLNKDPSKMTSAELTQRNKEIAQRRGRRVKPLNPLPMASPEQKEMLAMQQAAQVVGKSPGMAALLDKVARMPIKN